MRVANGAMALLFLVSAAFQLNDPDAPRWFAIYTAAAVAAGIAAWRPERLPAAVPLAIAVVALVWAAVLYPGIAGRVSLREEFAVTAMKTPAIEQARETGGLAIVGLWNGLLAIRRLLARRRA